MRVHHGALPSVLARRSFPLHSQAIALRFASTQPSKKYTDTLLLPKTTFPIRHKDIVQVEQGLRDEVTREYYLRQKEENEGPVFVLHDGPPYANGDLHMGHALNKLLKDFINRWKAQNGYRVRYIPGWDCHGLPIEHKALKSLGESHLNLSPQAVRQAARKTALEAIEVQKDQFRQLGIMADWDDPQETYRTLDTAYEIRQLKILRKMLEKGLVQHRRRPTYYSPSSRTALAEAELSYKDDHESHSVYVFFPVRQEGMSSALRRLANEVVEKGQELGLAIWTTTPWTLAANQAVAVHRDMEYALVRQTSSAKILVAAKERLNNLEIQLGPLEVIGDISGKDLIGTQYSHMFWREGLAVPEIIHSRYVTNAAGTGLVHSAPGHGKEDYEVFRQAFPGVEGQEIRCPVDDLGRMTREIGDWAAGGVNADALVGKEVLGDAVPAMVEILRNRGVLLAEEKIKHRYPCDWKTKEPIIIRATPQWFADVEALKPAAERAMRDVKYKPEQSSARLESFVESRSEWCISRQRSWGVPIPTLIKEGSDEPILTLETLDHIASVLAEKGTDHWWSEDVESFLTPELAHSGKKFKKGTDTMDVWFDSGTSWTLIDELDLRSKKEPIADVYLEGSDQHRGWFQSSLLTRLCAEEGELPANAPYKELVTHGFVLDQEGQKMSKSAGNGLTPLEVIHGGKDRHKMPAFGTDVMRLWAASVDYTRDVSIGPTSLSAAAENMRKVRNVFKYLLGNLSHRGDDRGNPSSRTLLDRYIMHETAALLDTAKSFYESHDFNKVLQAVNAFMNVNLSTLYFDVTKDALYSDSKDGVRRANIVLTLQTVVQALRNTLAPLTPHLVGEIDHRLSEIGLHYVRPTTDKPAATEMRPLLAVRSALQPLFEEARNAKQIGSTTDADLLIRSRQATQIGKALRKNLDDLPVLFGVSSVRIEELSPETTPAWFYQRDLEIDMTPVYVTILPAAGHKCPRCWRHVAEQKDALCPRCDAVANSL